MDTNREIEIPESDYEMVAIRASGPGGQHVNKVATAIQLTYNIEESSLSDSQKQRVLAFQDNRILEKGIIQIRVETSRSQLKNRKEAVERLQELLQKALSKPRKRIRTKPTRASIKARIKQKKHRSRKKEMRKRVDPGE